MSWEARIEAQRKAMEAAAREKQEVEDARQKAREDEKKRLQDEAHQRRVATEERVRKSESYESVIQFVESEELKAAIENIIDTFSPRKKMRRLFGGSSGEKKGRSEISESDSFGGPPDSFTRTLVISLYPVDARIAHQEIPKKFCMKISAREGVITYTAYDGTYWDGNGEDNAERDSWYTTESKEEFLDHLAQRIVSKKIAFYYALIGY